jgi:hypothetical protein
MSSFVELKALLVTSDAEMRASLRICSAESASVLSRARTQTEQSNSVKT